MTYSLKLLLSSFYIVKCPCYLFLLLRKMIYWTQVSTELMDSSHMSAKFVFCPVFAFILHTNFHIFYRINGKLEDVLNLKKKRLDKITPMLNSRNFGALCQQQSNFHLNRLPKQSFSFTTFWMESNSKLRVCNNDWRGALDSSGRFRSIWEDFIIQ